MGLMQLYVIFSSFCDQWCIEAIYSNILKYNSQAFLLRIAIIHTFLLHVVCCFHLYKESEYFLLLLALRTHLYILALVK